LRDKEHEFSTIDYFREEDDNYLILHAMCKVNFCIGETQFNMNPRSFHQIIEFSCKEARIDPTTTNFTVQVIEFSYKAYQ